VKSVIQQGVLRLDTPMRSCYEVDNLSTQRDGDEIVSTGGAREVNLLIPGPTPLPPDVRAAMAGPMVNHRGEEFGQVLAEVLRGLQQIFQTTAPVVPFAEPVAEHPAGRRQHAVPWGQHEIGRAHV